MKLFNFLILLCSVSSALCDGVVMCYYGSWTIYRCDYGSFGVSDLPLKLCTHIIYSFLHITAEAELVVDTVPEIEKNGKNNHLTELMKLKEKNEDLKIILAIGGWNAGSTNFSIIANSEELRARLVTNAVQFMEQNGFDGLDVDWEFPAQRTGSQDYDKDTLILLLRDLKAAMEPRGWLLTIAVAVSEYMISTSYNIPKIAEYVDYINLMTYDYVYSDFGMTGIHAPLYKPTNVAYSVDTSVKLWVENGAPPSKLVLGLATYGRSFTLSNSDQSWLGAPVEGPGSEGPCTAELGFLSYYEICLKIKEGKWNVTQVGDSYVYASDGIMWIGYDNRDTIRAKGKYAKDQGLAGIMFWTVDFDDFSGICESETYPLLHSAIRGYTGRYVNDEL